MTDAMPQRHHLGEPGPHTRTARANGRHPENSGRQSGGPPIVLSGVCKAYPTLDTTVVAADHVSLEILGGTSTALTGPSGSGKSTLLHLVAALDSADAGSITVGGRVITELSRKQLPDYRRTVGIVFQRFNLLPSLTVLDNVMAPLMPRKAGFDVAERARLLLGAVGLDGRENTLATRLSGGQQQRVAIARALINDPQLILADEPTGNLDEQTGEHIIELLSSLSRDHNTTILVVTHDRQLANKTDRRFRLQQGRLTEEPARTRVAAAATA